MNRSTRLDYIFSTHPTRPIPNRFSWLETALMGDIQTFIDGINDRLAGKRRPTPTKPRGGGNLSLPILTSTGLELVSALYVGDMRYRSPDGYNADDNVARFIQNYFPGNSKRFPRIIWDGMRNGLTHHFTPKVMRRRKDYFQFSFYVRDEKVPSAAIRNGRIIVIWFNSMEYFKVLRRAVLAYKRDLRKRQVLQINFIRAWNSIELAVKNLDKDQVKKTEVDFIRDSLRHRDRVKLFQ